MSHLATTLIGLYKTSEAFQTANTLSFDILADAIALTMPLYSFDGGNQIVGGEANLEYTWKPDGSVFFVHGFKDSTVQTPSSDHYNDFIAQFNLTENWNLNTAVMHAYQVTLDSAYLSKGCAWNTNDGSNPGQSLTGYYTHSGDGVHYLKYGYSTSPYNISTRTASDSYTSNSTWSISSTKEVDLLSITSFLLSPYTANEIKINSFNWNNDGSKCFVTYLGADESEGVCRLILVQMSTTSNYKIATISGSSRLTVDSGFPILLMSFGAAFSGSSMTPNENINFKWFPDGSKAYCYSTDGGGGYGGVTQYYTLTPPSAWDFSGYDVDDIDFSNVSNAITPNSFRSNISYDFYDGWHPPFVIGGPSSQYVYTSTRGRDLSSYYTLPSNGVTWTPGIVITNGIARYTIPNFNGKLISDAALPLGGNHQEVDQPLGTSGSIQQLEAFTMAVDHNGVGQLVVVSPNTGKIYYRTFNDWDLTTIGLGANTGVISGVGLATPVHSVTWSPEGNRLTIGFGQTNQFYRRFYCPTPFDLSSNNGTFSSEVAGFPPCAQIGFKDNGDSMCATKMSTASNNFGGYCNLGAFYTTGTSVTGWPDSQNNADSYKNVRMDEYILATQSGSLSESSWPEFENVKFVRRMPNDDSSLANNPLYDKAVVYWQSQDIINRGFINNYFQPNDATNPLSYTHDKMIPWCFRGATALSNKTTRAPLRNTLVEDFFVREDEKYIFYLDSNEDMFRYELDPE